MKCPECDTELKELDPGFYGCEYCHQEWEYDKDEKNLVPVPMKCHECGEDVLKIGPKCYTCENCGAEYEYSAEQRELVAA